MIGRGLRPCEGKKHCVIHDHAGNLIRLGLPDEDREYTLEKTPKRVIQAKTCTDCQGVFSKWTPEGRCPGCDSLQHQPEEKGTGAGSKREREVCDEPVGIDIESIKKLREAFLEIDNADAKGGRERTDRDLKKIANATLAEKKSEFLRLCEIRRSKGFAKGFPAQQYRATFGVWPRFSEMDCFGVRPATRPFVPLRK
jgi:superfamily II DNA or RNA helicase